MLTLKISNPVMSLKADLHPTLIFLSQKGNIIIIRSGCFADLACAIYSDTYWVLVFKTSLHLREIKLIFSTVTRQSTLLTRLEHDLCPSGVFLNALNN